MASSGSLTEIPKSLAHLDRVANGSLPPIPMDRRSSPRLLPVRSTRSAFATLSINPDIRTGTWAYSKLFPSTSGSASNSAPRPTTCGTIRIGAPIAAATALPISVSIRPIPRPLAKFSLKAAARPDKASATCNSRSALSSDAGVFGERRPRRDGVAWTSSRVLHRCCLGTVFASIVKDVLSL